MKIKSFVRNTRLNKKIEAVVSSEFTIQNNVEKYKLAQLHTDCIT